MITFCRLEGPLDRPDLDGGPSGGNGLADILTVVGLVMAEELLLPPWFELRVEAVDDGPRGISI